jgi:hypothetical protein
MNNYISLGTKLSLMVDSLIADNYLLCLIQYLTLILWDFPVDRVHHFVEDDTD